jgi:ATP-dependent Clp protease ATP-binding subunit ClpC
MFERYTEGARRVIFFARYEASQYGSPAIEPELLLLGLLKEYPSLLEKQLPHDSVTNLRTGIEPELKKRQRFATSVEVPLSNTDQSGTSGSGVAVRLPPLFIEGKCRKHSYF